MSEDLILTNARLVTEKAVLPASTLVVRDGRIVEIADTAAQGGLDCEGDYLLPGLVELHTDHLESHYAPRPRVRWDSMAALQAHDAQMAASGVTTVFDCLRLGSDESGGFEKGEMRLLADAVDQASREDRLRAEHFLHLRCEVSSKDLLDQYEDFCTDGNVRLASLMDHSPGQRQFRTLDQYAAYYKVKFNLNDEQFARFVEQRLEESARFAESNRRTVAADCQSRGIALASHDDATLDHVAEAGTLGVRIAEFPTSQEAAEASHMAGMAVLMGAPNVVRGKSHSGNIAARDLADAGVLDVLSSDYVPFSLLHAPFMLAEQGAMDLPAAIRLVTASPARAAGFGDRGRLAPGLRADLVRVRHTTGVPVVRGVWREGVRVA